MNLFREKLESLKDKITSEGVISRSDVASFESFFQRPIFTDNMNISMLSNNESSLGTKEVLNIINATISQEDLVQNPVDLDKFALTPGAVNSTLVGYREKIKKVFPELYEDMSKLFNSKFVENVYFNKHTLEVEGKFYQIRDIPIDKVDDISKSDLYVLCGNDEAEFSFIKKILDNVDKYLDQYETERDERGIPTYANVQLFTGFHTLKDYYGKTPVDSGRFNVGDNQEAYNNWFYGFDHQEFSNNVNLEYLLVVLYRWGNICSKHAMHLYKKAVFENADAYMANNEDPKNCIIEATNAITIYLDMADDIIKIFSGKIQEEDD